MSKIWDRIKQVKYYVAATVCASAVYAGFSMTGKTIHDEKEINVTCLLGDMGNNNDGQAKVAQSMHDSGCTTLVHLGDLIYPVGIKSADDKRFKSHWYNYYEDFEDNVIALGNHCHYGNIEAWLELSKTYENIHYPSHFYLHKSNDVCTVVWNSEIVERDDESEFVRNQGEFIDNLDLSSCKIKISAAHHPMFSAGNHGDAKKSVREFYERHIVGKFDYAFAGHDHSIEDAGKYKGTHFFVSGAGSVVRKCKKKSRGQCFARLGYFKIEGNNEPEMVFVE